MLKRWSCPSMTSAFPLTLYPFWTKMLMNEKHTFGFVRIFSTLRGEAMLAMIMPSPSTSKKASLGDTLGRPSAETVASQPRIQSFRAADTSGVISGIAADTFTQSTALFPPHGRRWEAAHVRWAGCKWQGHRASKRVARARRDHRTRILGSGRRFAS